MASPQKKPGFWQMVQSVLAAMFGVQSEHNWQRDFESNDHAWHYMLLGAGATALFIIGVVLLARLALFAAGV